MDMKKYITLLENNSKPKEVKVNLVQPKTEPAPLVHISESYESSPLVKKIVRNIMERKELEPPKQRNPVAKNANAALGGGAAGKHKDKKKDAKQGIQKHKGQSLDENDKGDFKRRELEHELGNETRSGEVYIDGKYWKTFDTFKQAQNVARSLERKGKRATARMLESKKPKKTAQEKLSAAVDKERKKNEPATKRAKQELDAAMPSKSLAEGRVCPQCGSSKCTCPPGKCKCKPVAGFKPKMSEDKDPCWKNYKMVGTKKKGSKTVPNCVPKESRVGEAKNAAQQAAIAIAKKKKKNIAEDFDSENNSWHVTDVDAVSETDFEVALQGPAGIKLNFVIRPVDFVETQRERYQIDTMDVRDLQSGKTMHWGSMQNLGKWEPIFDAIDEHFWNNRSLQAHLAKIIDYYMDAGEHGKNPDMMPDLGKRDPNGIAMPAKDFVATHNQADAAIKSAKKGMAETQLDELDRPSGKLYIIITTDNVGAPHVFGDFGSFPQDVMHKVSKRGTRDKSGAKTKLKIDFLFDDFRSTIQQLRAIFRDLDFIGAEAAEFIIKSSALRSDQGEDVKQLRDYIQAGDDRRMKMYQAPEDDEEEGEPTGGNILRIDPETGAARRVVGVKPQTQMGGHAVAQPTTFKYTLLKTELMPELRDMGFKFDGNQIILRADQRDKLKNMLGAKFQSVFGQKDTFKEGGEKYRIKSTGSDINPATGKRATYYISPSTGKKVYKDGVEKGDHESPKSGELKPKVEGQLSRAIMKEFGLK